MPGMTTAICRGGHLHGKTISAYGTSIRSPVPQVAPVRFSDQNQMLPTNSTRPIVTYHLRTDQDGQPVWVLESLLEEF